MAATERVLAETPDHAEALVWHGMGTVTLSQAEFQKGHRETGQAMFQRGLAEMDRAARLQPDNIGVRIPRGAVLRDVSRTVPPELGAALLENARSDFQRAFDLQKPTCSRWPHHIRSGSSCRGSVIYTAVRESRTKQQSTTA
jgi:hypothetical protein